MQAFSTLSGKRLRIVETVNQEAFGLYSHIFESVKIAIRTPSAKRLLK